ncbi:MAG: response regulator [Pseudomonadota bacterium]
MLALVLPTIAGMALLTYDFYQRARQDILVDVQQLAQSLMLAVDRQLDDGESTSRALATSPSLDAGDLAAFHAQASSVLRPDFPFFAFVLSDANGKALVNTRYPFGSKLPVMGDAAIARKVVGSGQFMVSPLFAGDVAQPYIVSVTVPVVRGDRVLYAVSAQFRPERLSQSLRDPRVAAEWSAQLFDATQLMVARSKNPEPFIGKPARPELVDALDQSNSGIVTLTSREGAPVISAFARTPAHNWTASVGVPRNVVNQILINAFARTFLIVLALLAIGFGTAWTIGGRIGRAVRALRVPAIALGRGEPVVLPELMIRETAAVAAVLQQVDRELQRYRADLQGLVAERTAELQRSNALLDTVYASAPLGLCFVDPDLQVVMINDYLAGVYGEYASAFVGATLAATIGEGAAMLDQPLRQVLASGKAVVGSELSGIAAPGDTALHYWIVSCYPVFGPGAELVGITAVVLDVTERRLLDQRMRDTEEQYKVLYERSGDAHMLTTVDAGFVGGNQAAATIFGCASIDEFLTLSPATTSPEFQPDGMRSSEKAEQYMRRALETGSQHFEWLHQRRDGSLFNADVLLTSIHIGGRGVIQATVRDITERIEAKQRLQALNEELVVALTRAELASSAKNEFVANMSHEIRTPMNAIMGLARLLEEAPLARRERDYVAKMKMSTQSLLGILNDVLDFSKIEAGQLTLEHTRFQLEDVLSNISLMHAESAWTKGIEPVISVAPDVPLELLGDPMRLGQVLLNLVSNAIKFTERGEVKLSVHKVADSVGAVVLAFSVRDTGIGIAAEGLPAIFDAFSQGDTSTSRRYGGTGLGLAICRRLVALMGGVLSVDSILGKGSTFRFELAFAAAAGGAPLTLPTHPALLNLSVLVVDDNASAANVLAHTCSAFGWQVEVAHSGLGALERLRNARAAQRHYDLMILDSAMPDLDGISVLTYARAERDVQVPPCLVSAPEHARDKLAALAGELHLDGVLCKPVTPVALRAALVTLRTNAPGGLPAGPAVALAGRLEGVRVLLVEDNQINQEVAKYILLHAGASVDIADNGRLAVTMLTEDPDRCDVVLMDIQMPVMNGYEASTAIRAMGLAQLPIIAMTANAMDDERQHAIDVGMNAHVAKPIDVDAMIEAINSVTRGGAERARRVPAAHAHPLSHPLHIPGIDLATTLPRFGGNYANFVALFKRFETSHGATVAQVRTLLLGADRAGSQQLVHRLRGVAANLGAMEVAGAALELEQALRGASDAEVAARLAALDAALATVLVAARELAGPEETMSDQANIDFASLKAPLAHLLTLLQNNNLKAMADYEKLRAALASHLAVETATALGDAVATLNFANAATLVRDILNRKDME